MIWHKNKPLGRAAAAAPADAPASATPSHFLVFASKQPREVVVVGLDVGDQTAVRRCVPAVRPSSVLVLRLRCRELHLRHRPAAQSLITWATTSSRPQSSQSKQTVMPVTEFTDPKAMAAAKIIWPRA